MKKINPIKERRGMTLMETILAVGIIMTVVISSITISLYTTRIGKQSQNKLIAINLAREGVEVARNIRDSNWLKANEGVINLTTSSVYVWNDGVLGAATCNNWCIMDYILIDAPSDTWGFSFAATAGGDITGYSDCGTARLYTSLRGIYNHDNSLTESKFCRVVRFVTDANSDITVTSKVIWQEGAIVKKVLLEELLTDWRE